MNLHQKVYIDTQSSMEINRSLLKTNIFTFCISQASKEIETIGYIYIVYFILFILNIFIVLVVKFHFTMEHS